MNEGRVRCAVGFDIATILLGSAGIALNTLNGTVAWLSILALVLALISLIALRASASNKL